MRAKGKLLGNVDGCIIFAANISFTALPTIGHLAKGFCFVCSQLNRWMVLSVNTHLNCIGLS